MAQESQLQDKLAKKKSVIIQCPTLLLYKLGIVCILAIKVYRGHSEDR